MSSYDKQCAQEFALLESNVEHYFAEMRVDCPYHLPHDAVFYQALFAPLPERSMELFLAAGYRRNGNCIYTMHCPECRACIPIRLHPEEMVLNRNQKRVLKKNKDVVIEFAPMSLTDESVSLCQKFLDSRYPHKNNDAQSYYEGFFLNRIIPGMEIRYRVQNRLIGTAIVDIGGNWMNAVYFYFDPDEGARSPGTFNILTMINTCLKLDLIHLYLGYYIKDVAAMKYKDHFSPHYLFLQGKWEKVAKA